MLSWISIFIKFCISSTNSCLGRKYINTKLACQGKIAIEKSVHQIVVYVVLYKLGIGKQCIEYRSKLTKITNVNLAVNHITSTLLSRQNKRNLCYRPILVTSELLSFCMEYWNFYTCYVIYSTKESFQRKAREKLMKEIIRGSKNKLICSG